MKPTVAILSSRFPYPLLKGDKLRLYKQMEVLSSDFDLHLICVNENQPTDREMKQVQKVCMNISIYLLPENTRRRNLMKHCFSDMPLQVRYFYDHSIKLLIQHELKMLEPDYIHVHLLRMFPYVEDLGIDIPKSMDFMDSMVLNDLAGHYLNRGIKSLWKNRERKLIRAYEQKALGHFDAHYIISKRDKNIFDTSAGQCMDLLPNGVNLDYFMLPEAHQNQPFDLIFCGNLSYRPNIEAAHLLIDRIYPGLSEYSMLIAGAEADTSLRGTSIKGVKVQSDVEDIRNVYHDGKVMLIPIFRGSGQQNKVLEAMACGVPCIVTSFVNEAIGAKRGQEVLIADNAESFILQAKSLLSHSEKRKTLGRSGRRFVEKNFNWKVNTRKLVETIKAAIHE